MTVLFCHGRLYKKPTAKTRLGAHAQNRFELADNETFRCLSDFVVEVGKTDSYPCLHFSRINSIDFLELQNSVHCRVTVLEGARFRKTTTERFLDVFIDTVNKNPPYEIPRNVSQFPAAVAIMR